MLSDPHAEMFIVVFHRKFATRMCVYYYFYYYYYYYTIIIFIII